MSPRAFDMTPKAMEDWWAVTPEELASLQGMGSDLLQVRRARIT